MIRGLDGLRTNREAHLVKREAEGTYGLSIHLQRFAPPPPAEDSKW